LKFLENKKYKNNKIYTIKASKIIFAQVSNDVRHTSLRVKNILEAG
jgi:polynucleotide 5'-kinase involved in rRNA processing